MDYFPIRSHYLEEGSKNHLRNKLQIVSPNHVEKQGEENDNSKRNLAMEIETYHEPESDYDRLKINKIFDQEILIKYENNIGDMKTRTTRYKTEIKQLTKSKMTRRKNTILLQSEIKRLESIEKLNLSTIKNLEISIQKSGPEIQGLRLVEKSQQEIIERLQNCIAHSYSESKRFKNQFDLVEFEIEEIKIRSVESQSALEEWKVKEKENVEIVSKYKFDIKNLQIQASRCGVAIELLKNSEQLNQTCYEKIVLNIAEKESLIEEVLSRKNLLQENIDKYQSDVKEMEVRVTQYQLQIDQMTFNLNINNKKVETLHDDLCISRREIQSLENRRVEDDSRLKRLNMKEESNQELINRLIYRVDQLNTVIKSRESEVETLKIEEIARTADIETLKLILNQSESEIRDLNIIIAKRKTIFEANSNCEVEIKALENDRIDLDLRINSLSKDVEFLKTKLIELNNEKKGILDMISQIEKTITVSKKPSFYNNPKLYSKWL